MNLWPPRFLKLLYRKEPISSFILLVGAVDAVIGGVGGRWTLFSLGLVVAALALVVRWRQLQRTQTALAQETVRHFLPPSSSRSPLPLLTNEKQRR